MGINKSNPNLADRCWSLEVCSNRKGGWGMGGPPLTPTLVFPAARPTSAFLLFLAYSYVYFCFPLPSGNNGVGCCGCSFMGFIAFYFMIFAEKFDGRSSGKVIPMFYKYQQTLTFHEILCRRFLVSSQNQKLIKIKAFYKLVTTSSPKIILDR